MEEITPELRQKALEFDQAEKTEALKARLSGFQAEFDALQKKYSVRAIPQPVLAPDGSGRFLIAAQLGLEPY